MEKHKKSQRPLQSAGPEESPEVLRSRTMRAVKSKDTAPELTVRRFLHGAGLRYRLHDRRLPGTPDLVFPARRIALFIHGCFWHQHPGCTRSNRPKSRTDYWNKKLDRNIKRDKEHVTALEAAGWTVLVIWECETRNNQLLSALEQKIKTTHPSTRKAL